MIPRGWRVGLRSGLEVVFGLEALEFLEGVAVVAVGGVDAALEAGEFVAVAVAGLAKSDLVVEPPGGERTFLPDLGFDDAESAEEPFGVDEDVDEHTLLGGGGAEALVILGFEGFEVGEVFAADDLGFGVDAGFQGIHAGSGFALDGARTGRLTGVEAIGAGLFLGCHNTGG